MSKKSIQRLPIPLLIIIVLPIILPSASNSEIVEKILATIEGKIFTLSDLEIAKTFALVEIVFEKAEIPDDRAYLERMIDAELIYREGVLLKIVSVTEEEVDKKLNMIKKEMGDNYTSNLERIEISEDYLKNLIREKLFTRKYYTLRKDFFLGFGKEEGETKMNEWLESLRNKASLKILKEVAN